MSDPSDGGDSEYNIITCVQCSAEVGKVYVRTSQETAKLQDLISLSTDAVCSYQLGRHEMRVQGTGDLNPLSEERVTRLEEQMVKVENVLVLFNERWHAMESALRQLQQRVDVVSTPSQRHGMAWGMGPGASPAGASPGGGGGGAAILARSVRAPRCYAGGCRLRVWTVNLQPTALRKEKFSGFHGDDYADYAVVHSRFKRAIRAPLSPARLSPHCAR